MATGFEMYCCPLGGLGVPPSLAVDEGLPLWEDLRVVPYVEGRLAELLPLLSFLEAIAPLPVEEVPAMLC